MARYPGVVSLDFPPEALEWSEKEVDMFVASGGFLKPKRKKPLAKSSATLGAVGAAPPCPEAAAGGGAAAAAAATTSAVESPELGALAWREDGPVLGALHDLHGRRRGAAG
ncbi:unnamed protein product [Prorocentrum cordatum]|uniref:Uncharacterized protein n=1 Tax=Prorocentrum cordatum TaxID=2364126 RepID=A0ABN9XIM4_9DINO|nr:unnamed protein product [Polarella glacialis]